MRAPDYDPAKRSLLFPDPVIEFYLARVDRAAIRKGLEMTPEERLNMSQCESDAGISQSSSHLREEPPNEAAPPMKFYGEEFQPPPSSVPMLFPDPMIAAYMKDVDRGLIRQALQLSVSERFERFNRLVKGAYALRRTFAVANIAA